jgi:hypothetical protein
MNTRFTYLDRDGSNYKQWGSVTFRGAPNASLVLRLSAAFDTDGLFVAHQVRLPELFFTGDLPAADDHCFHEMAEVVATEDASDDAFARTVDDFVLEVERAARAGWVVFDRFGAGAPITRD